jgi:hypothetical protein
MDVQDGADYAFEVECAIPCVATLPRGDSLLHGGMRVRLHAYIPVVSAVNSPAASAELNGYVLGASVERIDENVEIDLVLHARLQRPAGCTNLTSAEIGDSRRSISTSVRQPAVVVELIRFADQRVASQ